MAQATRTFRVFVSSTFADLKAERNALQERVFPRLRDLCRRHGTRFQAVDLRWGVSQEAGRDQRTMAICLDELARSQRTSPRPNFLVLLGDRYGWRPLPAAIPAGEFAALLRHVPDADLPLLHGWYALDHNALPPVAVLQPRFGEYDDGDVWGRVEARLRAIVLRALTQVPADVIGPEARVKYLASATEQEIIAGALAVADAPEHVHAFFRAIEGVQALAGRPGAADVVDLDDQGRLDADAHDRLDALKARLRERLPGHVAEYRARWTPAGVSADHLDALCADVEARLTAVIQAELAKLGQVAPLDQERDAQRAFGRERARGFVGRAAPLERIAAYVAGRPAGADAAGVGHPLVVVGASGAGKSALLARAAERARAAGGRAVVVERYVGATPGSADARTLLIGLCREIALAYGADEATVPTDEQELARDFAERLALATAERPLVIFVDALDQLGREGRPPGLVWLPPDLPEHARLVVSIVASPPGPQAGPLGGRLAASTILEIEPMSPDEGGRLLDAWLAEAGRTLREGQRAEVLGRFAREGLPLYLRLAFEEARRWRSYDPFTALAPDIPGIIGQLFARLAAPENHGAVLVERGLAYLAAARNGLAEDEVLDVLWADREVRDDFKRRSPLSPDVDRLPVVVWSRLYYDLEPYLTERDADGGALYTFYHRQLAEAVAAAYLTEADGRGPARHAALARYFAAQPLTLDGDGGAGLPNLRKLDELPYQQTLAAQWDDLFATLTDFAFLEQKAAGLGVLERTAPDGTVTRTYTGAYLLQDDYALALERMPAE